MKVFKWELIQLFLLFEPDRKIEIFFGKRGVAAAPAPAAK